MNRIPVLTLLFLLTCGFSAEAGYIFLKNGYILQGRVTDKDLDRVVLDYPGGSVTVERRFVKHVVLDPSEEALQAERRRQEAQGAPVNSEDARLDTNVPLLELPEDLNELIPLNRFTAPSGDVGTDGGDGAELVPDVSGVHPVNPPDMPELATERGFPTTGFAIQPPRAWQVSEQDDAVVFKTNEGQDFPNLKVRRFEQPGLSCKDAFEKLKIALAAADPGMKIVSESERAIGLDRALMLTGEVPASQLGFSQLVVQHGEHLYLIGVQWPSSIDEDERLALERSLSSIRFTD